MIFVFKQKKWKVTVPQSCPTLCNPMDRTAHGTLQARILEWVAFPFSRGSSQPGIEPRSLALEADSFPAEPQGKPREKQVRAISWANKFFPQSPGRRRKPGSSLCSPHQNLAFRCLHLPKLVFIKRNFMRWSFMKKNFNLRNHQALAIIFFNGKIYRWDPKETKRPIQIENELLEFIHLLDSRPQLWSVMGHSQLSI